MSLWVFKKSPVTDYLSFFDELLLRFDPLLDELEDPDRFTVPRLEDDLDERLTLPRLDEDRDDLFTLPRLDVDLEELLTVLLPDDERDDLRNELRLSERLLVDLTPDFPELLRTALLILVLTGVLDLIFDLEPEDLIEERVLIVADRPLLEIRVLLSVNPVLPVRRTLLRIAERVLLLTTVVRLSCTLALLELSLILRSLAVPRDESPEERTVRVLFTPDL